MESSSVIKLSFNNLCGSLIQCAQLAIDSVIDYDDEEIFLELEEIPIFTAELLSDTHNFAHIGRFEPYEAAKAIIDFIPKIDFGNTVSKGQNFYRVLNKFEDTPKIRSIIKFLITKIFAIMFNIISRHLTKETLSDSLLHFQEVVWDEAILCDSKFKAILDDYYADTFARISLIQPAFSTYLLQKKKFTENSCLILSSVLYSFKNESFVDCINPIIESLNETTFTQNICKMLISVFGQASSKINVVSYVQKIDSMIKEYEFKNYYLQFHVLNGIVSNMPTIEVFNIIQTHFDKNVDESLKSILMLLRGKNYQPESILNITHENYRWRFQNTLIIQPIIEKLTPIVKKFTNSYTFDLFSKINIQILSNNFAQYNQLVQVEFSKVNNKKFTKHIELTIFSTVMNKSSKFLEYSNNVTDKSLKEYVHNGYDTVYAFIQNLSMESPMIQIYQPFSLIMEMNELDSQQLLLLISEKLEPTSSIHKNPRGIQHALVKWSHKLSTSTLPFQETQVKFHDFKPLICKKFPAIDIVPVICKEELIRFLIYISVNQSGIVGSYGIRALQACILSSPSKTEFIVDHTYQSFINSNLDFDKAYLLLQHFKCYAQAIELAKAEYSDLLIDEYKMIMLIGFVSPYYQFRYLVKEIGLAAGLLPDYFVEATDVGKIAIKVAMARSPDIALKELDFEDMAYSKVAIAYMFMLSSFGTFMKAFDAHSIAQTFLRLSKLMSNPSFALNVTALLCGMKKITVSDALPFITQAFNKHLKYGPNPTLYSALAIVSSMNKNLYPVVIPVLQLPQDEHQRALMYILSKVEEYQAETIPFSIIHSFIEYVHTYEVISKTPDFQVDEKKLAESKELQICLVQFCNVFIQMTQSHFKNKKLKRYGMFPRQASIREEFPPNEEIFTFFYNMSAVSKEFSFSNSIKKAFGWWIRITSLTDEQFLHIQNNIHELCDHNSDFASSLLFKSYNTMLYTFVKKAVVTPSYFVAICNQFRYSEDYLQNWRDSVSIPSLYDEEQRFIHAFYPNIGSIVALAFYYYDHLEYQQMSFNLITLISTTIAFISEPRDQVLNYLDWLKMTKYDSETLCSEVSRHLSMCSEQFVMLCFKICTDRMIKFAYLWIKDFSTDRKNFGILNGCYNLFKEFTLDTFVVELLKMVPTVSVYKIIDKVMKKQVSIFLSVITSHYSMYRDACVQFMIYTAAHMPEEFIQHIKALIGVGAWYFFQIQNGFVDCMINFDSIVSGTVPDIIYKTFFSELTDLLNVIYESHPETLSPIQQEIAAFSIINYKQSTQKLRYFFASSPTDPHIVNNFKYTKSLFDFLFAWALCCGKLKKANIALKMLTNMPFLLKKIHIDKLLEAIYLITSLISERMSPDFMLPQLSTYRLLKSKRLVPDFERIYSYLANCMILLNHCEEFDPRVFWASVSMLHYSYYSAQSIFHNCLTNLLLIMKDNHKVEMLKTSQAQFEFEGLIPLLCNASYNQTTLYECFKLLILCVQMGYDNFLDAKKPRIYVALFLIAPNIWGNTLSIKKKGKHYSSVLEAIQKADYQKFYTLIEKKLTDKDRTNILSFYSQVIISGNTTEFRVSLLLAALIISHSPIEITQSAYSTFLNYETMKRNFLEIKLIKKCIMLYGSGIVVKGNPQREYIVCPNYTNFEFQYDLVASKPTCLIDCSTFPPMFPTDFGFLGCKIFYKLKRIAEQIKVSPLTELYSDMYRIKSYNILTIRNMQVTDFKLTRVFTLEIAQQKLVELSESDATPTKSNVTSHHKYSQSRDSLLGSVETIGFMPNFEEICNFQEID